ncbi:MAG: CCA tRNA nucleotidyltransferase [Defluviitaleaceae bacterium]|nr:CCA tRNA nucleotidyltransferase [Defluviitaleaceae bacterium]
MQLPSKVSELITTLNNSGHEAYAVGGCVRDALMGRTPGDFDITTSATPNEVKALFRRTVDIGIAHGTVTVLVGRNSYEVTTFRQDGIYLDNRRPSSVTFTASLQDDLSRRDFTMNAVAYHPAIGYVDPFGGAADIAASSIKCVGEPSRRFGEDALRLLRAVRFSAQLGFAIQPDTYAALCHQAPTIANVSAERIRVELAKLLVSSGSERFSDLISSGLWQAIDPLSLAYFESNFPTAKPLLKACNDNLCNRLSLLMQSMSDTEVLRLLKRLKFDNQTMKIVRALINGLRQNTAPDAYSVRKALSEHGRDTMENILYLQHIIAASNKDSHECCRLAEIHRQVVKILDDKDAYTISALAVNGNALMQMGLGQGEQIGQTLQYLLDQVCRDPSKNRPDELKKLARQFNACK